MTMTPTARHAGWSDSETSLLWETADLAQREGMPLKGVFEQIARQTGRRPNSIRNYYYAQSRERLGEQSRAARFVPFTEEEVLWLVETVLRDKAQGHSVRSCLSRIAEGDHSRMLRYQNKYRSVVKNRPALVKRIVEKLGQEGIALEAPEIARRPRSTIEEACLRLKESAQPGDEQLTQALDTIARRLLDKSTPDAAVERDLYRLTLDDQKRQLLSFAQAAEALLGPVKEYLALPAEARAGAQEELCAAMAASLGPLEACVAEMRS